MGEDRFLEAENFTEEKGVELIRPVVEKSSDEANISNETEV